MGVGKWLRGAVRGSVGRRTVLLGAAVATLGFLDPQRTRAAARTVGRTLAPGLWTAFSVPSTISPEWQAALRTWTGPSSNETYPAADDLDGWRALQRQDARAIGRTVQALNSLYQPTIVEATRGGVPVLDIRPRGWQDDGRVLVYTHGGAYTFNSARSTLSSAVPVAQTTGLRVISVDYTLAPASRWDQTTDEVVRVFESLRSDGLPWERIALYGDSAGGGLAAGTVLKLRDRGLGMPAALMLWSPWADITDAGDTYATLAAADPLLRYPDQLEHSAAAYADPADQRHPYVSAVYADFAPGFPPTLIQAGTKEIFLSNAVRLYRALDLAGVSAVLDVYEGMPHVFQGILPESTESQQAFARMRRFLEQHVSA